MRVLISIILLISCFTGMSQVEGPCADSLLRANQEFELGRFYDVPDILSGCINKGFTDEQKIQAHYLLTRNFIFLDDTKSAEENYMSLLMIDPEYRVNEEIDPIEIVHLSKNFITTPIFSYKFQGGANISTIDVINSRSTQSIENSKQLYYLTGGFQVGAGAELHLSENLSLGANLNAVFNQFGYRNFLFGEEVNNITGSVLIEDSVNFVAENISLEAPVFAKYVIDNPKFRPYAMVGYQFNYLLNSRFKFNYLDNIEPANDNTEQTQTAATEPSYNATQFFNNYTESLFFGIGAMYRLKYQFVFIDFTFSPGLKNSTNRDNLFPGTAISHDHPLNFKFATVLDDIRINTFKVNIGYVLPKYKPRKRDNITIRDFFERKFE